MDVSHRYASMSLSGKEVGGNDFAVTTVGSDERLGDGNGPCGGLEEVVPVGPCRIPVCCRGCGSASPLLGCECTGIGRMALIGRTVRSVKPPILRTNP